MNNTYYIYHIEGVKIGVSTNLHRRCKVEQKFSNYKILEEHTDIYKVSDREQELQKEYGYKVDRVPYWKSYEIGTTKAHRKFTKNDMSMGGKRSGKISVESGHLLKIAKERRTPILQYTKCGKFIKEFESQTQAVEELNISAGNLNGVLNGKRKTAGGFVFKYKANIEC